MRVRVTVKAALRERLEEALPLLTSDGALSAKLVRSKDPDGPVLLEFYAPAGTDTDALLACAGLADLVQYASVRP